MSTPPPKSDPGLAWLFAEKLIEEEEDARLAKLSDDELRAELEAEAGPEPVRPWSLDEALAVAAERAAKSSAAGEPTKAENARPAAPEPRASVVPILSGRRRTPWPTVGLILAASFVLVVGIKAALPPPNVGRAPPDQTAIVEALRRRAFAACAANDWANCKWWLDEAAERDPGGEAAVDVKKTRGEIAARMEGGAEGGGR